MRNTVIAFAAASLALMAGSAQAGVWPFHGAAASSAPQQLAPSGDDGIGDLIYLAAQTMAERAGVLTKDRPIIVATAVSIDDLNKSSTFGRLASQLVADRLSQHGYMVRDLTYMRALTYEPHTGELVLSRDASRILAGANAQAVVASTYAVGGRNIYLSLRMLRADNGQVLSTADVVLPYDHNMEDLIGRTMRWTAHGAPIGPHEHHEMPSERGGE
jgi:hypothetical protein